VFCNISVRILSETFLFLKRPKRDFIINVEYMGLYGEVPLYLSDFSEN